MGEAAEKLSGKLGIDTTDFKTGISAANRELRVLESGFKASAATLGDWTQSATGLETRIKSLTGQIDIQKLKVAALKEEHARLVEANGENSRAAQDAEIKLNKETEQLGKMENELQNTETALNEFGDAENKAGDDADQAGGKVTSFKDIINGIGPIVKGAITVVAGLAVAVGAVGAAIGGLVFDTANASAELVDLSAKTGISTTRLQELSYISDQVGTSQETITGSLARLTRSMSGAQTQYSEYSAAQAEAAAKGEEFDGKLGDSAAAFDKLGVRVTDASGNLRDSEAVFADAITALGGINNEAERDALAMSIFGKSAQELNPLIKTGTDELDRLAKKAHEVGAVMSEEDVAAFEAFDDTLASLQAGLKGTLGTLAATFLPGFQMVFDQAGGYLEQFKGIVDGSGGDIGKIATGVGELIGTIISDVAAQAPQLMETGVTILMSIVDAIITNLPTMITAGVSMLLTLVDGLITALPAIVDAGLQAIIELANGISAALPSLIPTIVGVITKIVMVLLENLPMLIDAALKLILALAEGLVAALPVLIPMIPIIVQAIFDALIQSLPMITAAAAQLIVTLALGIIQNIPALLIAAVEVIKALFNYLFNDAPKMMGQAGSNLIKGLWEGIKTNMAWLKQNFVSEILKVVDAVKKALGISSPSSLMADQIGANLPTGISKGFDDKAPEVRRQLMRSMLGLTHDLQMSIPTLNIGKAGVSANPLQLATANAGISIGDIYVDARGATDPKAVGQAVSDSLVKSLRSKGVL